MNNIKTLFLLVTLTLVLVWAGGAFGGKNGMTIALVIALGLNLFAYWFSDKLVLKMYRAQEVTETEAPELYGVVRRLVQKAGMPMPKVYMIEGDQPNAFATGRNPKHAAVAVTTGIMRILNRDELSGVIGHELSHIRHRDILISTIAATIAGAISYLAQMAQWAAIFGGRSDDEEGGSPVAALVMMIVGPIAALIIQMAISRSREYSADEGGAQLAGNPRYLSSALRKLDTAAQQIPMDATPATSHMFIVNPLNGGGLLKLFSTHPPIEERIARLESLSL
ncbi:MAG: protease HtpX [Nitrospirae bacterium CG_4_10_14_3_um_filter_44_29]|nr:zinc metalloprotease HtpX [Nitrospirota bacterium]OIO28002.1 MAG: protease HtpX [Nitrospirae bacterium CG1_02_44_142]PIP70345.1 MAG: protease HtpX [Nitrospirae bacterium CG22_combo_CG10-13_8_21_14_all_44_11]PIV41330.1 MAG: protease HtpX [Nitrospirae bacterium CG02_land_8_20_14_3_00_44_33]PIV66693.1 MAG: protease HtpX [Nitrospirae bacterium CG01_land_8_20_14_3_00_44_22]PIW89842.1 MAG: protease HtpX [Nitrospirae bacterium CG_4_8_14_3_um_filter_44_28]PIX87662.1 MAG: protease HtpX [Nitrospirae